MSHVAVWALPDNGEFQQEGEFKFIKTKKDYFYTQLAQQGVFTRLDHDGYLDIVETNGWWEPNMRFEREWMGERSYLFRNNGDLTFSEISRQIGAIWPAAPSA